MFGALEVTFGGLLIAVVLFDIFASVIVPRPVPATALLSGYLRRFTWLAWRRLFFGVYPPGRREIVLGFFAPFSVLLNLTVWLFCLIAGYGLVFYGIREQLRPVPHDFWSAGYFAGTTLLTIGYGDIVPAGPAARIVSLLAGETGLATVAIVLAYLFLLFNAYREREVFQVMLDARAGAPPSGLALLEIHAQLELTGDLPRFFVGAQTWCAQVLETHLAYPVLCYFRSAHVGASWVAALGAVLDSATLLVSCASSFPNGQAQLLHSVASHLVYDVAHYFRMLGGDDVLVERREFAAAWNRLDAAGYHLTAQDQAWQTFGKLRSEYAASLNNLARHLAISPAQWVGDRSPLEPPSH